MLMLSSAISSPRLTSWRKNTGLLGKPSYLDQDGSETTTLFKVNWSHWFIPLSNHNMVFLNQSPDNSEEESTSEAAQGDSRKRKRQEDQLGEGHRTSSWIWKMPRLNADQTANNAENNPFNTTVLIEWAKTKARAERWQEEVILLKEEMHQVIVDMEW